VGQVAKPLKYNTYSVLGVGVGVGVCVPEVV